MTLATISDDTGMAVRGFALNYKAHAALWNALTLTSASLR